MKIIMFKKSLMAVGLLYMCVGHVQASHKMDISFNMPYPSSPLKKAKCLAMKLWSQVYEAYKEKENRSEFYDTIEPFSYAVTDLNVLCDVLMFEVISEVHGYKDLLPGMNESHFKEEMKHLSDIIKQISIYFEQVVQDRLADHISCARVTLVYMRAKIDQLLYNNQI